MVQLLGFFNLLHYVNFIRFRILIDFIEVSFVIYGLIKKKAFKSHLHDFCRELWPLTLDRAQIELNKLLDCFKFKRYYCSSCSPHPNAKGSALSL